MGKDAIPTAPRRKTLLAKELERAHDDGFQQGLDKGRQEILDWLQAAYIGPNAPDRDTPEAKAILKMAQDASLHFQKVRGKR